ncbi:MAG: hypothetical protein GY715_11685 [Planctomycetes bacterium]|nr:hypothetical protein [Planctomycetota bacterium]
MIEAIGALAGWIAALCVGTSATFSPALLPSAVEAPAMAAMPPVVVAPVVGVPGPVAPAAPTPAEGDDVERLLAAQELAARNLRAFTALVHYVTDDELLGDRVIRKGRIVYEQAPKTGRRIALMFDTVIENKRKRARRTHFVFSDRWLVEIDHDEKLFIKREIAAPGETFDPFRLGEGPIPLPIGQPASEVLARFDVKLVDLPDDGPLAKLIDRPVSQGLRLVPKPGTPGEKEYERIDLFYERTTRLPVGIAVVEPNGDRKTVRLDDVRRNVDLDASQRETLRIEEPDPAEWRIDIRPLQR